LRRSSFDDAEIFAEIGAARGSRVEFFTGDAYSFRRLGKVEALEPKLVNRLYWRKWRAANPERARAYVNKYAATSKGRAVAKAKKLRWQRTHREAYNAAQRAAYARRVAARKVARS
jgi:hypothetical protein